MLALHQDGLRLSYCEVVWIPMTEFVLLAHETFGHLMPEINGQLPALHLYPSSLPLLETRLHIWALQGDDYPDPTALVPQAFLETSQSL